MSRLLFVSFIVLALCLTVSAMPQEESNEMADQPALLESELPTTTGPTNRGALKGKKGKKDKLSIALGAVKEEIMVRARELHNEKDWVKRVEALVSDYQTKLKKVTSNIDKLRKQTKALLRKKKQIQNAQIQIKLKAKLQVAHGDMNRLQKQMAHIQSKQDEFADTEKRLKDTMSALKGSLLKLRGEKAPKQ